MLGLRFWQNESVFMQYEKHYQNYNAWDLEKLQIRLAEIVAFEVEYKDDMSIKTLFVTSLIGILGVIVALHSLQPEAFFACLWDEKSFYLVGGFLSILSLIAVKAYFSEKKLVRNSIEKSVIDNIIQARKSETEECSEAKSYLVKVQVSK